MKNFFPFLAPLSVLAGALMLSSCGGGGSSGPSTTSGSTTSGTTAGSTTAGTTAGNTTAGTTAGNTTSGSTTSGATTSGGTTAGATSGATTAGGVTAGGTTAGTGALTGQIGFVSTRGGNSDIYAMDANGNNQRALTALNSSSEERSPSISRDGNTIVWSSDKPNQSATQNFEIYIQRPDGLGGQKIESYTNDTNISAPDDTEPIISPDGTKIAWTTTRGGDKNIAVTGIIGGAQPTLTLANPGEDSQPTWTSDSQSIAFYSERGNSRGIYIMNADGSNQRPLLASETTSDVRYSQPSFAPSGGGFAVTIETGNGSGSTISLRNANGTAAATNFNAGSGFTFRTQPNFSRDGSRLIYLGSNSSNGSGQIQTSNLDGTSERPLTSAGQNFDARFSG